MTWLVIALIATLARALLAEACGKALELSLEYFAPGIPELPPSQSACCSA